MMTSEHPQLEDLLLWRTGELSPADAEAIESHLEQCSVCQNSVNEIRSVVERVVKVDAEAERRRKHAASQQRWDRGAKVFKSRTFMGTTASIVIGALLFVTFTQWTPEARAESLLNKAIQEQAREHRPVRFLKIESGSESCNVALGTDNARPQLVSVGATNFCANVSSHLAAAGRQWSSLLSAKSFQQWRHSLTKKHDSVHKSGDTIEVSTSTNEGILREATLRLQSSNYRPIGAHFEFAGAQPMEMNVEEDHAAEERAARALSIAEAEQQKTSNESQRHLINPLDETDAQLRLALHRAQLDSNILLAVERRRNEILVWGVVPSETDQTAIHAMAQHLSHVRVSVRTEAEQQQKEQPLPWTAFQGNGAPLAYQQLETLYPHDGPARQEFQNDLDALTRRLVGEAKSRDALLVLRSRLSTTQYDRPLESAEEELADSMRRDTLSLAVQLAPLTGPIAHAGEPLHYRQAMRLYTLVHEIALAGSNQNHLQLSQALSQTRRLLSGR